MEGDHHLPGDPILIDKIVSELKSQGLFDQLRKDCFADVDTKPAYQNLCQRVEGSVSNYLSDHRWKPELNKNQLRDSLRKHIYDLGFLDNGVELVVNQVVNAKVYSAFVPKVEAAVYNFLGVHKPSKDSKKLTNGEVLPQTSNLETSNKNEGFKTKFVPTDLDPISPDKSEDSVEERKLEIKEKNDFTANESTSDGREECEHNFNIPEESNLELYKETKEDLDIELMEDEDEENDDSPPFEKFDSTVDVPVLLEEGETGEISMDSNAREDLGNQDSSMDTMKPTLATSNEEEQPNSLTQTSSAVLVIEDSVTGSLGEDEVPLIIDENVQASEENTLIQEDVSRDNIKDVQDKTQSDENVSEHEKKLQLDTKREEKYDKREKSQDKSRRRASVSKDRRESSSEKKSSYHDSRNRSNREKPSGEEFKSRSSSSKDRSHHHDKERSERKREDSKSSSTSRRKDDYKSKSDRHSRDDHKKEKTKEKSKVDDHKNDRNKRSDDRRNDRDGHRSKDRPTDGKDRSSGRGSSGSTSQHQDRKESSSKSSEDKVQEQGEKISSEKTQTLAYNEKNKLRHETTELKHNEEVLNVKDPAKKTHFNEIKKEPELYASTNSEGEVVMKYKKPKIAANIYEIKKIMQLRKNVERLERKRTMQKCAENLTVKEEKDASQEQEEGKELLFAKKLKFDEGEDHTEADSTLVSCNSTNAFSEHMQEQPSKQNSDDEQEELLFFEANQDESEFCYFKESLALIKKLEDDSASVLSDISDDTVEYFMPMCKDIIIKHPPSFSEQSSISQMANIKSIQ